MQNQSRQDIIAKAKSLGWSTPEYDASQKREATELSDGFSRKKRRTEGSLKRPAITGPNKGVADSNKRKKAGEAMINHQQRLSSKHNAFLDTSSLFRSALPNEAPGLNDVIWGRGKLCSEHPGNKKFKKMIQTHLGTYQKTVSKAEKSLLVTKIVNSVRRKSTNGGFLKKDSLTGEWKVVSDRHVRERVSQMLRDALHTEYRSSTESKRKRRQVEMDEEAKKMIQLIQCNKEICSVMDTLASQVMSERCQELGDRKLEDMFFQANVLILDELKRVSASQDGRVAAWNTSSPDSRSRTAKSETFAVASPPTVMATPKKRTGSLLSPLALSPPFTATAAEMIPELTRQVSEENSSIKKKQEAVLSSNHEDQECVAATKKKNKEVSAINNRMTQDAGEITAYPPFLLEDRQRWQQFLGLDEYDLELLNGLSTQEHEDDDHHHHHQRRYEEEIKTRPAAVFEAPVSNIGAQGFAYRKEWPVVIAME